MSKLLFLLLISIFSQTVNANKESVLNSVLPCDYDLKNCLKTFYTNIFDDPSYIDIYFSPDYTHHSDGDILKFKDFKAHITYIKPKVKQISFIVTKAAKTGNTISDRHVVTLELFDGSKAMIEVIQISYLKDNKIYEIHELSRILHGKDALQKLKLID
ncbi:hypothetical protein KCM76_04595 [Zooshikella marina]|uniref:hypothetical protein n=1 Tax=Zooshikella ganghwensis TaxID=202772 RepID=UPI001BAF917C|nr:hypothetical protein [Zooshikella ganghwensis]MBU2705245.1 hypothetical protein [Zooshikella ganghwensis]